MPKSYRVGRSFGQPPGPGGLELVGQAPRPALTRAGLPVGECDERGPGGCAVMDPYVHAVVANSRCASSFSGRRSRAKGRSSSAGPVPRTCGHLLAGGAAGRLERRQPLHPPHRRTVVVRDGQGDVPQPPPRGDDPPSRPRLHHPRPGHPVDGTGGDHPVIRRTGRPAIGAVGGHDRRVDVGRGEAFLGLPGQFVVHLDADHASGARAPGEESGLPARPGPQLEDAVARFERQGAPSVIWVTAAS